MASTSSSPKVALGPIHEIHLAALSAIRDEVQHLFATFSKPDAPATQTLKQLFWYLSARCQAVSFLVSWEYAWDAEIILRSFYETAAKIIFICKADASTLPGLINEYWDGLGLAGDKRRARKAEFAEEILKKSPDNARVFEFLRGPGAARTSGKTYSRAERKALNKKWSFSEIVETLEQDFPGAKSLLHAYGMASHLIHADPGALELMMDRALRAPGELPVLHASHICRIFGDLAWLNYWCAICLRNHLGGTFLNEDRVRSLLNEGARLAKEIQDQFDRSQDEFYAEQAVDADPRNKA